MMEEQERIEKAARLKDDERKREAAEWVKSAGQQSAHNVIAPRYERDNILNIDREVEGPPDKLFMGLGWDEDSTTNRKHYRRFYPYPLEKVKELMPKESPFQSIDIKRGQTRGAKASLWSVLTNQVKQDASGSVSTE